MTGFWKRPRRMNYAVNNKRPKSVLKVDNILRHYETLKKRVKIEWETKWLKNAFLVTNKKLKKYWIKIN